LVWLIVALVFGLVFGLYFGLLIAPVLGLALGLFFGLALGQRLGLEAGGEAVLKHATLRLRLICNGSIPWNYVRFLDYAAERILLRKVGGGYTFIHRMLLEHFALHHADLAGSQAKRIESSPIEGDL
jgi:hypothetical protein